MYLLNPSTAGKMQHKVKAGLNSEFSFSQTGCLIKDNKKNSQSYYLPITDLKADRVMLFKRY